MKNKIRLLNDLTFAVAISITTSGCISPKIYYLGVTERRIEPKTTFVALDGSVAFDSDLILKHGSESDADLTQKQIRVRRYLYKDAQSMNRMLNQRAGNKNVAHLYGKIDNSGETPGAWKMIPYPDRNPPATPDDLPKQFTNKTVYPIDKSFPYMSNGKIIYLQLGGFIISRKRALWSYPCQILLIPVGIIELITVVPLVYFMNPHRSHEW